MEQLLKRIAFFGLGIAILGVAIFFWFFWGQYLSKDVLLPNVPYSGIYTYDPRMGSALAGIRDVFEYWHEMDSSLPTPSLDEMRREFPQSDTKSLTPLEIRAYFLKMGFEARIERLNSEAKIARVLDKERTPLIYRQLISSDYPIEPNQLRRYYPYRTLIGISSRNDLVTVHDVYFGPAYSMSYDEFIASYHPLGRESDKSLFVIARPKNYKAIIASATAPGTPYPDRSEYDKFHDILIKWVDARDPTSGPYGPNILPRYQEIADNPLFNDFPPVMKVYVYSSIAENFTIIGDYDQAIAFAQKALAFNNNLDAPYGIWTSFRKDEIGRPWLRLGEAYAGKGDTANAIVALNRVIEIESDHQDAKKAQAALSQIASSQE